MKKTLVVLLALVMVFAFATTAMAADTQYTPYGDIATQDADTQTAIERLTILGALKGYNAEGTIYAPANLVTREEFATIGVRIAGLEDQVPLYASLASAFKDVEEGRWSEGYINCANANGIMIGRGAGLFDPKANVTMQEVVTVLLRAVGYTDQLKGSWPTDYNRKAVGVGLTEYVDFIGPKYATRGEVAALVNEAIDLWIVYYVDNEFAQGMGQIGWGPEGTSVDEDNFAYKKFKTNEEKNGWLYGSLLNETFDAYEYTELTFEDYYDAYSEGYAWGFVDFEDWELEAYYWDTFYDSDDEDVDYTDNYYAEFATLYGISGGMDLTDLGFQVADVTFNDDDEIVYIDIQSEITRTADADKDYDETYFGDYLYEEDYGEVWFYDWSGRGTRDLVNYYAAKDFSNFDEALFGIVDSVDKDDVNFKDDGPVTGGISLDDDNVFYLMGTGFIDADDLQENDVVYQTILNTNEYLYLAFRLADGALGDYGDDYIEIAGDDYAAITNYSFYSIDSGETVVDYDAAALTNDFSKTVAWTPAYAFVNFAYFVDDIQNYKYGIIDSYTTKGGQVIGSGDDSINGVNILLPGEDDVTNFKFDGKVLEPDWGNLPIEGSLIELTLNSDGEILLTADEDALLNDKGYDYAGLTTVLDYTGKLHGAATDCEWNTGKTKLTMTVGTDTDVYTFTENAVIFVLASDGLGNYDSAESMTLADFKAEGDFEADDLCVYKANNEKISVLYVLDMDATGDVAYNIGLFTGKVAKNTDTNKYYAYIGGQKIQVKKGVYDDLLGEVGYVAYKTTAGVVLAGNYQLLNLGTLQADLDAFDDTDIYDELGYEYAVGTLDTAADWTSSRLEVTATIATVTPATLTLDIDSGLLGSFDLWTEAAAKYNDWTGTTPVLVIYDSTDDVVYYLVDTTP